MSPGIALAILVLCINMFGDAVRDYLYPRLRTATNPYITMLPVDRQDSITCYRDRERWEEDLSVAAIAAAGPLFQD